MLVGLALIVVWIVLPPLALWGLKLCFAAAKLRPPPPPQETPPPRTDGIVVPFRR